MSSSTVLIEIRRDIMLVLDGDTGLEIALERSAQGRLSDACRERVVLELGAFLQPKSWQPRRRAICALSARGVSLRRVTLPWAPKEQVAGLLRFQIEREFPLPPEELAWGCLPIRTTQDDQARGGSRGQDYWVAAARSGVVQDYTEALTRCGLSPVFTLSALARSYLSTPSVGAWSWLELDRKEGEWISFEHDVPTGIQVVNWGLEALQNGKVNRSDFDGTALGRRWVVTGPGTEQPRVLTELKRLQTGTVEIEVVAGTGGSGRSSAVMGLKRRLEQHHALPALTLNASRSPTSDQSLSVSAKRWAMAAGILVLACVVARLAETRAQRSRLAAAIATVRAQREALPKVDYQLGFLQYLQSNRPPYLQVIGAVARASSPGMRVESVSLNRRGELLLRGSLPGQQTATNFRARLVESGLFTSVIVEEQAPTPDQQKVQFRIAARWDSDRVRETPEDWGEIPDPSNPGGPPGMPSPFEGSPTLQAMPPGLINRP